MNSDNHKQHQPNSPTKHKPLQSQHQKQQDEIENISPLSIKLPSSIQQFNNDDDPTTPTSSDHKIPVPTTCPPAPRKPGSVPVRNKRKTPNMQRIAVDLMVVFNAVFIPPAIVAGNGVLAGDLGAGERAKKVKKADVTIGSST